MKTIVKLSLLIWAAVWMFSSCSAIADNVLGSVDERYLYLVAGFDDAAENTDVLFTLGYDKAQKHVYVAQIPRDTYYSFGGSQNKINQLYSTYRSRGDDATTAMSKTADAVSTLFGTEFDGYIGITTRAFRDIVDAIGGVDINLKSDLSISIDGEDEVYLSAGENHIDGTVAEKFVRYRKGYARADLGRIDAQKVFLNALFAKLSQGSDLPTVISLAKSVSGNIVTDLNIVKLATFVFTNIRMGDGTVSSYATVPGEAAETENGLSYYILNRKSAAELAKRYMFATKEFDAGRKCTDKSNVAFLNIYEDEGFTYKEYSNEDIANIHITTGQ